MQNAAGVLGRLPLEIIMMIERILHDETTFTEDDIPIRYDITTKGRQSPTPRMLRPLNRQAWSTCRWGRCTHDTSLECDDQWLVLRLDENEKCLQVWYGAIEEDDAPRT